MSPTLSHWINGQAVAGQSGRTGDVFNPAIGEKIAEVPLAGDDEVANVVAAAKAAAPEWAAAPPIRQPSPPQGQPSPNLGNSGGGRAAAPFPQQQQAPEPSDDDPADFRRLRALSA